jgi:hypothetical protein
MEAAVAGARALPIGVSKDDERYAADLGLLKKETGRNFYTYYRPASPICREAAARGLTSLIKLQPSDKWENRRWLDGTDLDMNGLMGSPLICDPGGYFAIKNVPKFKF